MLKQLEIGIPADMFGLLEIPIALERGEYLALYNANIRTAETLLASDKEMITSLLGKLRSADIEQLKLKLIQKPKP